MRTANFIEEAATSIGGVNGNGAITMAAVDGMPRFAHALGTRAATVRYSIEDTVGHRMETGVGVVADGVLTRVKVATTWDGANYVAGNAAPLAFGAAPAAGTVRVRLAGTAEHISANHGGPIPIPLVNADAWNQYPLSAHMGAHNTAGSATSLSPGAEYYLYYRLDNPGLLQGLQFDVTGANATSVIRMALYSLDANSLPDRKIVDFGIVETATTGIKTVSDPSLWTPGAPVWLTPGWYAIGYQPSYGISIRGYLNGNSAGFGYSPVGRTTQYAGYKNVLKRSSSWNNGSLPEAPNLSDADIVANGVPWIGLKVTP